MDKAQRFTILNLFNTIEEIAQCIYFPYVVLFVFAVVLLALFQRKLLFFLITSLVSMICWRSLFYISSSRYCAVFLFVVFITVVFSIKGGYRHLKKIRILAAFVVLVLLTANVIITYSSFRNNYIFDVKDDLDTIRNHDKDSVIFLERKEFQRVWSDRDNTGNKKDFLLSMLDEPTLRPVYELYDFGVHDAYFAFSEKKSHISTNIFNSKGTEIQSRKIRQYCTDSSKTKFFSIYKNQKLIPHFLRDYTGSDNAFLNSIKNEGILKVYQPLFDVYVFQVHDKLIWMIGSEIDQRTEIIYQLHTSEPDLLPPNRIQYQFDNLGFRVNSGNELEPCGKYRVFEKNIPKEYPITHIMTGFWTDRVFTWVWNFQLSQ